MRRCQPRSAQPTLYAPSPCHCPIRSVRSSMPTNRWADRTPEPRGGSSSPDARYPDIYDANKAIVSGVRADPDASRHAPRAVPGARGRRDRVRAPRVHVPGRPDAGGRGSRSRLRTLPAGRGHGVRPRRRSRPDGAVGGTGARGDSSPTRRSGDAWIGSRPEFGVAMPEGVLRQLLAGDQVSLRRRTGCGSSPATWTTAGSRDPAA